jgi:hypothetical protein
VKLFGDRVFGAAEFGFFRFRFHLRAIDLIQFPPLKSANTLRGAFGLALRRLPAAASRTLFAPRTQPGERLPSGLSDWPRPFVFRTSHLDAAVIAPGETLSFELHDFQVREPSFAVFVMAIEAMAGTGLGLGRGRASLERVEQLDLEGRAETVTASPGPPCVIDLGCPGPPTRRVRLRFLSPTELKSRGSVTDRPEFSVLFARLRDRFSTLRALYGAGPLQVDFRALGGRAEAVRLVDCDLVWEAVTRRSGRTGQVHSIGGFTGDAEYEGDLGEFLPWLRAARWVGVGRQTVWGKGDVRVVQPGDSE